MEADANVVYQCLPLPLGISITIIDLTGLGKPKRNRIQSHFIILI